jgi:hypothetical protein
VCVGLSAVCGYGSLCNFACSLVLGTAAPSAAGLGGMGVLLVFMCLVYCRFPLFPKLLAYCLQVPVRHPAVSALCVMCSFLSQVDWASALCAVACNAVAQAVRSDSQCCFARLMPCPPFHNHRGSGVLPPPNRSGFSITLSVSSHLVVHSLAHARLLNALLAQPVKHPMWPSTSRGPLARFCAAGIHLCCVCL